MFRRFESWIRGKLSVSHARCQLARDRDRVSRRKSNREVSLQELSSLTDDVSGLLTGKRTYGYCAEYQFLILGGQSQGIFIFGRLGYGITGL